MDTERASADSRTAPPEQKRLNIISFHSLKGGVGKTTLCLMSYLRLVGLLRCAQRTSPSNGPGQGHTDDSQVGLPNVLLNGGTGYLTTQHRPAGVHRDSRYDSIINE